MTGSTFCISLYSFFLLGDFCRHFWSPEDSELKSLVREKAGGGLGLVGLVWSGLLHLVSAVSWSPCFVISAAFVFSEGRRLGTILLYFVVCSRYLENIIADS